MPTLDRPFRERLTRTGSVLLLVLTFLSIRLAAQVGCPAPQPPQNAQSTLTLRADHQQWVNHVYTGRGHVMLTYGEMRITASEISYDQATGLVRASGRVVFDDPRGHFEASGAQYNILTDRGSFSHVRGYIRYAAPRKGETATSLYLRAEKISRLDEETYTVEGARASSCENSNHGLAFGLDQARIEVGRNVTAHGAVFRFIGVPFLYLPYFVVSASRRPRQTGFLVPQIGESTQKGFVAGDGFFWAINPSADLLLGLQDFSRRGVAFSGRFRATPSSTSKITADFFAIDDRASGSLRNVRAPGGSFDVVGDSDDIGDGFRGVINASYVNSLAFRSTWSETFNTAVFSEARQAGFATKNFGAYSLNFYASRYQDFLTSSPVNEQSIIIRHAPSISFTGVDQQIRHSPFFFGFETSADGVGRSSPGFVTPTLTGRFDLFPHITLRSRPLWGFHFTPTAGVRETFYSTSLRPGSPALNRFLGELSLDLQPPPLEKVFSHPLWGLRLKHVIQPDFTYTLVKASDPQNILDIVRFDTTDILTNDNEVEWSLTNSIFSRKANGKDTQSRDLISWTLAQKYFFDPTFGGVATPGSETAIAPALSLTGFAFPLGRRWSPIDSVLRVSPVNGWDAEFRTDVDPSGGGLLNAGITSRVESHTLDLALTDFFVSHTVALAGPVAPGTPLTSLPSFNLLDLMASHGNAIHTGLTEAFRIDYNTEQNIMEDFIGQASYNFGCFSVNAQYERFNLGSIRNENLLRLSITLGNIGTFGSLKPGQFLQRQLRQIP